jgi:hypothetical protein
MAMHSSLGAEPENQTGAAENGHCASSSRLRLAIVPVIDLNLGENSARFGKLNVNS